MGDQQDDGQRWFDGHRFQVLRAADMVVLDVEAHGMRLDTRGRGKGRLVADGDAQLVVELQPQHLGEEAWLLDPDTQPVPGRDDLADVRLARNSRLVFAVPAGERIEYSSAGVLAAMRRLPLVVAKAAAPAPAKKPKLGEVLDLLELPGGLVLGHSTAGPVLRSRSAPAEGPDALIGRATALRAARVHLARDTALDLRRDIDPGAGLPDVAAPFRRLFGPGGLIRPERFPGARKPPPELQAPGPRETAIEAPWRVILSPSALAGFTHAERPVGPQEPADALGDHGDRGRFELWHTRLGIRDASDPGDVRVDEGLHPQRVVRAIWARDRELYDEKPAFGDHRPFRSSLDPHDRWWLVRQTTEAHVGVEPVPADVRSLTLSALGAWLDVHGAWDAKAYTSKGEQFPLVSWDHLAPMGRDQFVQVVYAGYLWPLGHQAVLIKQTERKVRPDADPVARLFQRLFLVVTEPERTHAAADFPFTRVRFTTLRTPPLRDEGSAVRYYPRLQSTGEPVQFGVEALDHDGRAVRLHMPLVFVEASQVDGPKAKAKPLEDFHRASPLAQVPAAGQRIAFAPSSRPGDTSAEVRALRFGARFETRGGVRVVQPRLQAATIVPSTARHLTPQAEPLAVDYHPDFAAAGGFDPGTNAAGVFLRVIDPAKVAAALPTPPGALPKLGFGSTERTGGLVDPAQQIAGLSRELGTVGDLQSALQGDFDPVALLGDALPKLFGLIKLTDVLDTMGLDQAPKFVTEALSAIGGLLADLQELEAALRRAAAQAQDKRAELEALAAQLASAWAALDTAFRDLGDPATPTPAGVEQQVRSLFEPFGALLVPLRAQLPTLPITATARAELDRLVNGVLPYVEDAQRLADAVQQALAFLQGLDPADLEVRAKLDWTAPLVDWPAPGADAIFHAGEPLRISVESRAGAKGGARFDAAAELTDVVLTLIPPEALMRVRFDRLAFRAGSAGKPDVDVVFGGVEFLGPLSFVETLKELIPLDGFSDPPFLDVTPEGARAGFTLGLPSVAIGVFSLENISLGADCHVPFLGEAVTVGFTFCTRERPFVLTVSAIGGGGFLGLRVGPDGLQVLELSLEFGARLSIDLGVASGSVEVMGGVYLRLEGKGGSLAGFFRIRGEVDVLGLISASIELAMQLEYEMDTGKMVGSATITVEVDVLLFSGTVRISAERRFAGSNGDPTFAELMEATDGDTRRWDLYCDAFSKEAA